MRYVQLSNPSKVKRAKVVFRKFLPFIIVIAAFLILAFVFSALSGTKSAFNYIFDQLPTLRSSNGAVNILLLGNAGGLHDGAYLTDSIIVASYNLKTNKVYLFSLPRDLWLDETKSKINATYEIGRSKGAGLAYSKAAIGNVLGLDIHYAVRVDFRGFTKAIDEVGGIDVVVERSFDDYLYPIEGRENDLCEFKEEEREINEDEAKELNIEKGKRRVLIAPDGFIATDSADPERGLEYFKCRYEHISYKSGLTHMDGTTALKFVRSRMGNNGEGSDFARSKRQQLVLEVFRTKVLSLQTLTSPTKISGLLSAFGQTLETDIPTADILELYKLTKKQQRSQSIVLATAGKKSLLINPPLADYGGAWVLVPREGNYSEIHNFVSKVLRGEEDEATASARTSNN